MYDIEAYLTNIRSCRDIDVRRDLQITHNLISSFNFVPYEII